MLDLECNDIFWKSLMRDVVRHNLDKKGWCGDACSNFPIWKFPPLYTEIVPRTYLVTIFIQMKLARDFRTTSLFKATAANVDLQQLI